MKYQVECLASDQSWIWEEFRYEWAKIVTKTSLNTLGFELPGGFDLSTMSWQFWNPFKVWAVSNWNTFSPRLLWLFLAPRQSVCPSCQIIFVRVGSSGSPTWPYTSDLLHLPSKCWDCTHDQTFLYNMHKHHQTQYLTPGGLVYPWDVLMWSGVYYIKHHFLDPVFWSKIRLPSLVISGTIVMHWWLIRGWGRGY